MSQCDCGDQEKKVKRRRIETDAHNPQTPPTTHSIALASCSASSSSNSIASKTSHPPRFLLSAWPSFSSKWSGPGEDELSISRRQYRNLLENPSFDAASTLLNSFLSGLFPTDFLLEQSFGFLSLKDLCNVCRVVCRRWLTASYRPAVWISRGIHTNVGSAKSLASFYEELSRLPALSGLHLSDKIWSDRSLEALSLPLWVTDLLSRLPFAWAVLQLRLDMAIKSMNALVSQRFFANFRNLKRLDLFMFESFDFSIFDGAPFRLEELTLRGRILSVPKSNELDASISRIETLTLSTFTRCADFRQCVFDLLDGFPSLQVLTVEIDSWKEDEDYKKIKRQNVRRFEADALQNILEIEDESHFTMPNIHTLIIKQLPEVENESFYSTAIFHPRTFAFLRGLPHSLNTLKLYACCTISFMQHIFHERMQFISSLKHLLIQEVPAGGLEETVCRGLASLELLLDSANELEVLELLIYIDKSDVAQKLVFQQLEGQEDAEFFDLDSVNTVYHEGHSVTSTGAVTTVTADKSCSSSAPTSGTASHVQQLIAQSQVQTECAICRALIPSDWCALVDDVTYYCFGPAAERIKPSSVHLSCLFHCAVQRASGACLRWPCLKELSLCVDSFHLSFIPFFLSSSSLKIFHLISSNYCDPHYGILCFLQRTLPAVITNSKVLRIGEEQLVNTLKSEEKAAARLTIVAKDAISDLNADCREYLCRGTKEKSDDN